VPCLRARHAGVVSTSTSSSSSSSSELAAQMPLSKQSCSAERHDIAMWSYDSLHHVGRHALHGSIVTCTCGKPCQCATSCCRLAAAAQLVNKLLYRSKQRGFLELDLLVGLWAEQQVPVMDLPTLQSFAVVLDQVKSRHRAGQGVPTIKWDCDGSRLPAAFICGVSCG
jgi:Flavinator of succinate dehydrogenase